MDVEILSHEFLKGIDSSKTLPGFNSTLSEVISLKLPEITSAFSI